MIYLVALQSFISSLFFLFKKPKHFSNYMLAFFFLLLLLNCIGVVIPGGLKKYTGIGYLPFIFLYGPIFYFYVHSLITENFKLELKNLVHLVPFLIISIIRLTFWGRPVVSEENTGNNWIFLYLALILPSLIYYIITVFFLLLKHEKNLENHFSSKPKEITLNWVKYIMFALMISSVAEVIILVVLGTTLHMSHDTVFTYYFLNVGTLGYFILLFGIQQPILFGNKGMPVSTDDAKSNKYTKSVLSKNKMTEYAEIVMQYLSDRKPYLNPEYNLETMAKDLDIHKSHISQTINEINKKNFYQLINEFRVEEFKALINHPKYQHYSFLGLAYEVGFNSKASFNRIFKETTGMTPTDYKQKMAGSKPS